MNQTKIKTTFLAFLVVFLASFQSFTQAESVTPAATADTAVESAPAQTNETVQAQPPLNQEQAVAVATEVKEILQPTPLKKKKHKKITAKEIEIPLKEIVDETVAAKTIEVQVPEQTEKTVEAAVQAVEQKTESAAQTVAEAVQEKTETVPVEAIQPQTSEVPAQAEAADVETIAATVPAEQPAQATVPINPEKKPYKVWRVYHGDIFRLVNDERIVLIGIDVPDPELNRKVYNEARRTGLDMNNLVVAGRKATQYARGMVQGQMIWVEFDEEKYDTFKRMQGYVFLQDGTFVNGELVRAGYARAVKRAPNTKYQEMLENFEKEARANKRGLWGYGILQKLSGDKA